MEAILLCLRLSTTPYVAKPQWLVGVFIVRNPLVPRFIARIGMCSFALVPSFDAPDLV